MRRGSSSTAPGVGNQRLPQHQSSRSTAYSLHSSGTPFSSGNAAFAEAEPRAGDEILDGARDEHFSGPRRLRDPGADVDCDPADLAVHHLALARVQAGAHVEAQVANTLGDRTGAADRARRPVETREEAVAGDVELGAAEANELAADQRVMTLEELPPRAVAELRCFRRRADDVGEEDGGEDSVGLAFLPTAGVPDVLHEALELDVDLVAALAQGEVAGPRDLHEPCGGHA